MNSALAVPASAAHRLQAKITSRIPSLDGLRGIAILLVLLGHGAHSLPASAEPALTFLGNASLGVRIFFVLSGYLIYSLSIREIQRTGTFSWSGFYIRRVLRIFPSFYLYIGAVLLLTKLNVVSLTWPMLVGASTFSLNYPHLWDTVTAAAVQPDYYVIAHYWTLSLEEQFYLTWPLLILLFTRRKLIPALVAVIVIAPVLRTASYFLAPGSRGQLGMMFHTGFDAIAAGVLLGELLYRRRSKALMEKFIGTRWVVPCVIFFLVFLSPLISMRLKGAYMLPVGISLELASLCIVIAAAVTQRDSILFRVLNWRPIAQIGVLSYSLYVWNNMFLCSNDWTVQQFPLNFICLVAVALISYHLVEKPVLRLKDCFHSSPASK